MNNAIVSFCFYWTLGGSIFYLFHFLLLPLEKRIFPPIMRNWLLRINLVVFLFPMPSYSYRVRDLVSYITGINFSSETFTITVDSRWSVPFRDEYILFPKSSTVFIIVSLLLILGILANLMKYIFKYRRFKKTILCNAAMQTLCENSKEYRLCRQIQRQLKLRKNIDIFSSPFLETPFACGIFKYRLYVPENWAISPDLYETVLFHEITHLKRRDTFFKFLASIVMILHWYNPFVYLLFFSLSSSSEFTADFMALKGRSPALKRDYELLVLSLSGSHTQKGVPYNSGFIYNQKKFLKERILIMKRQQTNRMFKGRLPLFGLLLLTSLTLSSVPVLGYNAPVTADKNHCDPFALEGTLTFSSDLSLPDTADFSSSNIVFIDESGRESVPTATDYRSCSHSYTTGYTQKHIKNSSGGCTVYVYKTRYCVKCYQVTSSVLDNTITYNKCPH